MAKPNSFYSDGLWRPDVETTVIPRVRYPFAVNPTPDRYSKVYEREYNAIPTLYTPKIATRTSWTNILTYSEQLDNAAWTKNDSTISANAATAPDGNVTMDKVLEAATTAEHDVTQAATVAAASNFAGIFAQAGVGRDWIKITFTDSGATAFSCFFNVACGYVGVKSAGVTAFMTPMGGSQYLCGIVFSPAAGAGTFKAGISTDGSTVSYAGDITKGMYLWGGQVVAASVIPPYVSTVDVARAISAPNCDCVDASSGDPFAYLAQETDPKNITSAVAQVMRGYARIPLTQTSETSIAITKPVAPNQATASIPFSIQGTSSDAPIASGNGAYYNGYLYGPTNRVYGILKTGTAATLTSANTGQFRVVYRGSTTANLNYNALDATINAAINGLASVVSDGLTVSVTNSFGAGTSNLRIDLTVGTTSFKFYVDSNSFNAAASSLFTYLLSATTQFINIGYRSTIAAHGFSSTQSLVGAISPITTGGVTVVSAQPQAVNLSTGSWALVDSNTIAFDANSNRVFSTSVTIFGNDFRSYAPGPDRVGCKLVQSFYLPGVTSGISTALDIPIPAPLINDVDFLAAVVANTSGYLNYDADPLGPWLGPIYQQTQKQINMADV